MFVGEKRFQTYAGLQWIGLESLQCQECEEVKDFYDFQKINGKIICKNCAKVEKQTHPRLCPRCGHSYPLFDEQGKHNFVPTVAANGEIVNICLDCKMKEVKMAWNK